MNKILKTQNIVLYEYVQANIIMCPIYYYSPSTIFFTRDEYTTGLEAKSSLPPVFVVLMEHNHTHSFMYCL